MSTLRQRLAGLRTRRARVALVVLLLFGSVLAAPLSSATGPGRTGTVQLRTVPATPGVQLNVAGVPVVTDASGRAQLAVSDLNGIARRITVTGSRLNTDTTVRMTHVHPDPHVIAHVSRLSIGLALTSTSTLRVTSGVATVSPDQVRSIRLHSITGTVLTASPGQQVALLSRRAVLRHGALVAEPVTWSADRISTIRPVAVTSGGPRFDPFGHSAWFVRLAPVAGTVTVRTVPKLAGVTFGLGAATLTTGSKGSATSTVPDLNVTRDPPTLVGSDAVTPTRVVRVTHVTTTGPRAPKQRHLLVALAVSRPVTFRFVDPRGVVIPTRRIQQVQLNQAGRTITIGHPQLKQPVLLRSAEARQEHGQWQARTLRYTVTSVRIDGVNAVFAGRQRIDPAAPDTWQLRLSVYALTLTVHDALFGRRVASTTSLTSPYGMQQSVRVGDGAPTRMEALPRGLYHVQIAEAAVGGRYPVLVSRNTVADLRVITREDIALVAAALLIIAVAMVYIGQHLNRRARAGTHRRRT